MACQRDTMSRPASRLIGLSREHTVPGMAGTSWLLSAGSEWTVIIKGGIVRLLAVFAKTSVTITNAHT